jgi:hypothetical protein
VSTLTQLQTKLARELRDADNDIFSTAELTDAINAGIVEVSRISPNVFREDVETDGSLDYTLAAGADDIEVRRVELWEAATPKALLKLPPAAASLSSESEAGWDWWGGTLSLPSRYANYAASDAYFLRVWGYKPWDQLVNAGDTTDMSPNLEAAVLEFAILSSFERLAADRMLYAKWQANANNTDVSMASLVQSIALWQQKWNRRKKELLTIREIPD